VLFVLREVFDTPYAEIAEAIGKSQAAVRQIAHRARQHVAARRPRMQVDPAVQEEVLVRFMSAARTGQIEALLEVLAPDVVLVGDGGGEAASYPRPVEGALKVAAALVQLQRLAPQYTVTTMQVNGAPALLIEVPGDVQTLLTATVADGRITRIYAIRNPHKLSRIAD